MSRPQVDESPEGAAQRREDAAKENRERRVFALRLGMYMQRMRLYEEARATGTYPPEFVPVAFLAP